MCVGYSMTYRAIFANGRLDVPGLNFIRGTSDVFGFRCGVVSVHHLAVALSTHPQLLSRRHQNVRAWSTNLTGITSVLEIATENGNINKERGTDTNDSIS